MKRIRDIGLLASMVLALGVFPGMASATGGLESEIENTTLLAQDFNGHTFYSPALGLGTSCGVSEIEASMKSSRSATVVGSPAWSSCTWTNIKANGCKFEFHPGSENSVDIGPPGCGPMTTTISSCEVTIGSKAGLPATYTNAGGGGEASVIADLAVSGIPYKVKKSLGCAEVSAENGTYSGEWDIQGFEASSPPRQVGIHATDGFVGFYLAGKQSEKEAEQPRFEAEEYPVDVSGAQDPADKLELAFPARSSFIQCDVALFDAEPSSATSDLAVQATYSGCKAASEAITAVTVTMNSCDYGLDVNNAGPPYVGDADVSCSSEGDAIKVVTTNTWGGKCTFSIPSQDLGPTAYENLGAGSTRHVGVDVDGSGIDYSYSSSGFLGCGFGGGSGGSASDGTFTGGLTLLGP